MKGVFFFALFTLSQIGNSQNLFSPIVNENGFISFEKVINIQGKSKEEIFILGKTWMYENFISGDNAIDIEDKEQGIIIGKGKNGGLFFDNGIFKTQVGYIQFYIKLLSKDEKSKIILYNIEYINATDYFLPNTKDLNAEFPKDWSLPKNKKTQKKYMENWSKWQLQLTLEFNLILENYTNFLAQQETNSDW